MYGLPHVILASQSPRRHELLTLAGIAHTIFVSGADEGSVEYWPGQPEAYVHNTARLKGLAVREVLREVLSDSANADFPNIGLTKDELRSSVILAADTIVYSDETQTIFGKPGSEQGAFEMLRTLSGRPHRVITGVMLHDLSSRVTACFAESTEVHFRKLKDDEIWNYIRVHRPMDKAGAYGIQDGACVFVEKIVGDYYNVVGLPVCRVYTTLRNLRSFAE